MNGSSNHKTTASVRAAHNGTTRQHDNVAKGCAPRALLSSPSTGAASGATEPRYTGVASATASGLGSDTREGPLSQRPRNGADSSARRPVPVGGLRCPAGCALGLVRSARPAIVRGRGPGRAHVPRPGRRYRRKPDAGRGAAPPPRPDLAIATMLPHATGCPAPGRGSPRRAVPPPPDGPLRSRTGGGAPGHGPGAPRRRQTPKAAGYRMVPAGSGRVSSSDMAIMASSGTSKGARIPKREAGVKPNRG